MHRVRLEEPARIQDMTATVLHSSTGTLPVVEDIACPTTTDIVHEMSESFGRAIDAKDSFTKNHSDEVAVVSQALALELGLSPRAADIIHIAGHLHDIGKIGVPDSSLKKAGALSEDEWRLVRQHPATGAAILSPVKAMELMGVPELVLCHHERFDGRGYPHRLSGIDIPLGSRIIALADSLSAMLQSRPYRPGMDFDKACREIAACSGTQFDPVVVSAFTAIRAEVFGLLQEVRTAPRSPLAGPRPCCSLLCP